MLKKKLNAFCLILLIYFAVVLLLFALIPLASASIVQNTANNFTLTTSSNIQVKTFWDGVNAYWYIIDQQGTILSYWTFPTVNSYKTSGGGSWQIENPVSVSSNLVGSVLWQNYTLDSGSRYYVKFQDMGTKIKMTWGINGSYNRNYRINFKSNGVPSNKAALDNLTKIFDFTDVVRYNWNDINGGYTVSQSVDANKNFNQYIEVGNAYNSLKWIDPNIERAGVGTSSKSCTALVNGSPCNFSSAFTAISGTFNVTGLLAPNWANLSYPYRMSSPTVNSTIFNQYPLTLHVGTGSNNQTDVYSTHLIANYAPNRSYINMNFRFYTDNTTDITLTNRVWVENISADNNTIKVWVNKTVNGSDQIYIGAANFTYNNSLGLVNTFIRSIGDDNSAPVVAAYNFDGQANDLSGKGNNGVLNGGVTYGTSTFGQEAILNGLNGVITLNSTANKPEFDFRTGDFAVRMKLTIRSFPDYITLFGDWSTSSNTGNFRPYSYTDKTWGMVVAGTASESGSLLQNAAYDTGWSRTSGTVYKYRNGTTPQNFAAAGNATVTRDMRVGSAYITSLNYAPINVDYLTLYNRSLSSSEWADLYNNTGYVTLGYPGREMVRRFNTPELNFATWGAEESQASLVSVWVIPQNHPQSEIKTCSATYCSGNITLTAGNQVQNHSIWGNWSGTANVTLTYQGYYNATNVTEYTSGGYYYYNTTVQPGVDISNAMLTFQILDSNFINSPAKGSISVYTNDSNATTTSFNTTYIKQNSSYLSAGVNKYYNFTVPMNYPPVVSASNQGFEFGNPINVVFSSTDTEGNTLRNNLTINSIEKNGSSPINFNGLAIGNYTAYLNVTDYNGTVGGAYTWSNITFWVNVTADVTPPAAPVISNGTAGTTTIPLISTNSGEVGGWYLWEQKVNGTSSWTFIGNTTTNTTTATGLTSGQIYDLRLRVNDSSGNPSAYSNTITVQTLTTDPTDALILQQLADIKAKQIEQDATIANAGVMGFIGGLIGGAMVIGVLRRKR